MTERSETERCGGSGYAGMILARAFDGTHYVPIWVDEDVRAELDRYSWLLDKDGYAYRMERIEEYRGRSRRKIRLHRWLLGLEHGDSRQGDHINGDISDNRRSNLRILERGLNQRNVHRGFDGSSRFRGVGWNKKRGAWRASFSAKSRSVFLGYFDDEEEAARVVAKWREDYDAGRVDIPQARSFKRWTPEEDAEVLARTQTDDALASSMGRTLISIRARRTRLRRGT